MIKNQFFKGVMLVVITILLIVTTGCTNTISFNLISEDIIPNEKMDSITLITVNGLSFSDLEDIHQYPHLERLANEGIVGGLNLNTAGVRNAINNYVSIGAGTRAIGVPNSVESYIANEDVGNRNLARDLYRQRTGVEVANDPIVLTTLPLTNTK